MRRLAAALVASTLALVPLTVQAEERTENLPPITAPDSATVTAGHSVTVPVLANDTDDGLVAPLEVVGVEGDPRATYDKDSVFFAAGSADSGTATFEYEVSDGQLTTTGEVTVTITSLQPKVTLSAPEPVVALRATRLTGQLTPARAGRVVLERRTGSKSWRVRGRTNATANGSFVFTDKVTHLQRVRYRARASGTYSPVLIRRVTATADVVVSGPLTRRDVRWSYRAGCPVAPPGLRRLRVTHVTYTGRVRRGEVVVSAGAVPAVQAMFERALAQRFPFKQLRPADYFYADGNRTPTGSDLAAMRADNTSAFNCRAVTGNPYRLSQHSYGNAIDINTVRNPYVTASKVYPSFARTFLHRGNRREGMLFKDGVVVRTFRSWGWLWGARWAHPDYQHFSANGG